MRVLGRVRLSRSTEESTSPERQRELIEQWAEANGHELVGWAEDLDVSGSVDPFDTPALGPWLTPERAGEWDILCAWKLDRVGRRAIPLNKVFGWILDNNKTLYCVSDSIDLSNWVGRLVASVIAGVAEGELEAIKERARSSHKKLRELGRWPGGKPSYGYVAVERLDAAGWELVEDEPAATVLRGAVAGLIAGKSVEAIARELTEAGTLTPTDHALARKGKPTKGGKWTGQTLRQLLRSKTLLGHVTHNGVTVRDSVGKPIHKGPPIVSSDDFDRVQAILDSRSNKKLRSNGTSPMLGVALCFDCNHPLYANTQMAKGKLYRYYSCKPCKGAMINAEEIEQELEYMLLETVGDSYATEKHYIPAQDHQTELNEAVQAINELTDALVRAKSNTVRERLTQQIDALDERIEELEKLPQREAGWDYRQLPITYREQWEASDTEERRQLLLRAGITLSITRVPGTKVIKSDLYIPDEILDRLNEKKAPTIK